MVRETRGPIPQLQTRTSHTQELGTLDRGSAHGSATRTGGGCIVGIVDIVYPGFGAIVVEGERFEHDVVVEAGRVRPRKKGRSKVHRHRYGHTPLSAGEDIPWSSPRLVVGTGASGQLPIMPEVWDEARTRGIELIAAPTVEACRLLGSIDRQDVFAILHVTC